MDELAGGWCPAQVTGSHQLKEHPVSIPSKFTARDLASVDGQIILALADGPLLASEIYALVRASQPTVSRRLGYLLAEGVLSVRHTPDDRRCNVYSLNPLSMWKGFAKEDIRVFGRLARFISNELSSPIDGEDCCTNLREQG
jgi:DNA-binding transcriptional ArsR family regulator